MVVINDECLTHAVMINPSVEDTVQLHSKARGRMTPSGTAAIAHKDIEHCTQCIASCAVSR